MLQFPQSGEIIQGSRENCGKLKNVVVLLFPLF